jgi:hypothetical protein
MIPNGGHRVADQIMRKRSVSFTNVNRRDAPICRLSSLEAAIAAAA